MTEQPRFTRRAALVAAGSAGVSAVALAGARVAVREGESTPGDDRAARPAQRMPVVFVPHGGGPWPFVDLGFDRKEVVQLAEYLRSVRTLPKTAPKALLVISAHWEAAVPTVMSGSTPALLFDYYGFPPESYEVTWPAPGQPQLAARAVELLAAAGFDTASDAERGFDHGTFVPLKLTYPEADVPVIQLSLKAGLDAAEHLAMGRALAPLRDEGVLIIGSGMSFHNMRAFRDPRSAALSETFDSWLREAVTLEPEQRDQRLAAWSHAPGARFAHPREEHLLPLMVVAGAAGADRGSVSFSGSMMGAKLSGFQFG